MERKMRKASIGFAAVLLMMTCVLAMICDLSVADAKAKPQLNHKTVLMKKGQNINLKLKNAKKAKWASSNEKVATVSQKGKVKAKEKGDIKITAKYKGKKYKCSISVSDGSRKTAVIYFSATGTTKNAAKKVAKAAGADIVSLIPKKAYTSADLDYDVTDCRANKEQRSSKARPALATAVKNLSQYDKVYLGYPIWWGKEPKIIRTFLDKYSMKGKTVIPFCTSGSSGISGSMDGIKAGAKGATVLNGRDLTDDSYNDIRKWVK